MARKRERITWYPTWNKDYERWSQKLAKKHKWRCDPMYEVSDLTQEAYLTFDYIAKSYPRVVDPVYFFSLFKRAMINKMHDRSCFFSRRRGTVAAPIGTDIYEVFAGRMVETTNSGYITTLLKEAPEELQIVMAMLADGRLDKSPSDTHPVGSVGDRAKKALSKLGYAVTGDPVAELKELLRT